MRHMPGSNQPRSLHQLGATVGFVCECQLRHNRSGRMASVIPAFWMCCPVESLACTKVASAMKPSARTRFLAGFAWQSSMGEDAVVVPRCSLD